MNITHDQLRSKIAEAKDTSNPESAKARTQLKMYSKFHIKPTDLSSVPELREFF